MEPLLVLVAGPEIDLGPVTRLLWAHRIGHRVVEINGQQHLFLARREDIPQVRIWIGQWREGQLPEAQAPAVKPLSRFIVTLAQIPVTLLVLLLLSGIFLWMQVSSAWEPWTMPGADLWPDQRFSLSAYADIGVVAFFLPALLHLSLPHLVFNGLWWWILGRAIERRDGGRVLLVVAMLTAVLSSMVQWWFAGPGFAGASGVTMGLLGWIGWRQHQKIRYPIPPMLLPMMVGFLFLSLVLDSVFPGMTGTAHGAHFGGLLAGFILAALWSVWRRPEKPRGEL
ncbi:rhomboid family intramembrane serine protease [Parathalassolituus penaei]|uniref:Rhomboid family intramembrane serine protease n=1 Tax=Parathalassolituus penaei TaxID=2997323 RepID=A0A9X3ISH4_9GAMM|nr:rhomboid family intramembrane serine protease [Parathalassolituus penaei]MCY0966397.1 rhomboid family intramembrane serine protease [Parathalassolituus penaei]